MLKTDKTQMPIFFALSIFFILIGASNSDGEDELNLGPLLTIEKDGASGSSELNALGPFFTSRQFNQRREYGLRPLFYYMNDDEKDSSEFDFLYPISTYDRRDGDWRFQFLIHLLYLESKKNRTGYRETEFNLFPFFFIKSAENKDDSHFAFFPLFGKLKNKFYRDEITFVLFPLFLQTKDGEEINQSFLWPFFGFYKGGGQRGFKIWPLFGYRKKENKLDDKFALWPIFISRRMMFYGEERKSFSIFPLYSISETPERTNKTLFWPFFNYQEDRKKGTTRWDAPWPFISFTRGNNEGNRVFPFFSFYEGSRGGSILPSESREEEPVDSDGFILWPLYRYSFITLEDYRRRSISVLLILYKDIYDEPIVEGGKSGRRVSLWPLFSYERDSDGNRKFEFLSLIEPLISGSESLERNYSPLWQVLEWKRYKDGRSVSSILWNTIRTERNSRGATLRVQPIIPILSIKRYENESRVHFFGGLFGYQEDAFKRSIKLFFIPIKIYSKNGRDDGGGVKVE